MRTLDEARANAQIRADALRADYVVFRDTTCVPPFAYGCCSAGLWSRANPNGMLLRIDTIQPVQR